MDGANLFGYVLRVLRIPALLVVLWLSWILPS